MSEYDFGGSYWPSDTTWQDVVSGALTLAVAVAIGMVWQRWRDQRLR